MSDIIYLRICLQLPGYFVKAGGLSYDEPAFFTVRSLEGKMFLRAESVRLYRGFGSKQIRLGGRVFEVDTEVRTRIW